MIGSEHLTTQIAMGSNGNIVKKIISMLALMPVLTSFCSGQIVSETNLTSVIIEKNRFRTSSDYVYRDANDDNWQTQLALAQSQAEQAAASTTESNLWVSGTAISFTQSGYYKNLAGKIYRVYAAYVQRDQDLSIDLSAFSETNGYADARFLWEIGHGESTAEAYVARQYHLHENPHTYEYPLVLGGTNELTIELVPWWTSVGHAGIGPNTDPRHVTIRQQLLEAPRQCLVPQAAEAGEAKLINTITGNESLKRVDIHVSTPGIPLEFSREYHSLSPNGWAHNYGMTLTNKTTVFQGTTNSWKVLSAGPAMWHFKQGSSNEYDSPLGTSYELDILSNGNALVQFDYATTALFDTNGVITELADGAGNSITFSYTNDATAGLVVDEAEHSCGLALDYSYSNGLLTRVDSPSTNLHVLLAYDSSGRVSSASQVIADASYTESYGYEESVGSAGYNLITFTNPVGEIAAINYATNSLGQKTDMATSAYIGTNRYLETEIGYSTNGTAVRTVTVKRDGEDLEYEYQYHPVFEKLEAVIGPNAPDVARAYEKRYVLDEYGNTEAIVEADWGQYQWTRTDLAFDSEHQVTNIAFGLSTDDPTNEWVYTWHDDYHTITSVTDPEGRSVEFDYTNGLMTASRLVVDTNTSHETVYTYTTNGLLASVTNANGHYVGYDYDSYGFLKEIDPQAGPTITLSNNVLGHLVKIELPGWEGSTTPGGASDPRVIELEPDGLGQVGRITYPDELEETSTYDGLGNLVTNVDRAGRFSVYTYEPLGRLSSATRYLVEGTSTQDVTIAFGYDQQFNTLEITDPLDREVEAYQLDDLGRAVSITNVDDQVMTVDYGVADYVNSITRFDDTEVLFTYGQNGLLSSAIYDDETLEFEYFDNDLLKVAEVTGVSITNSYNSVNRLTNVVTVAGSVASDVSYTYFPGGQVSNMTTEAGTVTFSYDAAERVTDIVDSVAGTFEHSYNTNNGLVQTVEYPNDVECSLDYDVMDRLTAISWTSPSGTLHSLSYQYDSAGMITNRVEESPSGTRNSAFTYDSLDRLTGETYSDGSGTVFDEVGYEYGLAGNRTNKTHNGVTVTFSLGAGNRMTNWTAQVSTNAEAVINVAGYSSEDIGTDPRYGEWTVNEEDAQVSGSNFWSTTVFSDLNQTSHTVIAAIGDEAGNVGRDTNTWALTVITNAAYTFDDAGNVTEIAYNSNLLVRTLGWDSQYQLTTVSNGTTEVESYGYDPFGRRLTTSEGTNTITHLYDGIHCVADMDASGGLVRSYTYGPGVDNPLAMTVYGAQTNTYYYLTDHLGSVLALTDEDGQLVECYEYDAFGRVKVFDEGFEEIAESAYGNRITFQGREYSWATGLYYFRARWYEPVTGRWLSKDPIGISGGLNQYVAFENNPVLYADPDGLSAEALALGGLLEWSGGGAAVGAGAVGAGLLAGATGVAGGMAIDRYWDYMTGESLSDRIGDWIGDLITPVLTPEEIADLITPAETTTVCDDIILMPFADEDEEANEHTKNKRPSTRERHEAGRRRYKKDGVDGEKKDPRMPWRRWRRGR